jgi:hypothetical protein
MRSWCRTGVVLGGLAVACCLSLQAQAQECVSTGVALDFGRYPIGASALQAGVPGGSLIACADSEGCTFRDQGLEYQVEAYEDGMFIARKQAGGAALNAWGRRTFGWRTGDTLAVAQAQFQRATGKTLKHGANDVGEIFLHDVCATGPNGPYQFYANFGTDGRLKGVMVRIESPYE